jgi:uncharacterized metal-binding protein YceD (DUF177 family)
MRPGIRPQPLTPAGEDITYAAFGGPKSRPLTIPGRDVSQQAAPEFRRMIEVATLGEREEKFTLAATPEERAALAKRIGVDAVEALEAEAFVRAISGDGARARVTFQAAVVQSSVVTLEPVQSRIDEAFEVEFLPRGDAAGAKGSDDEDEISLEGLGEAEAPEPPGEVVDGWFDLGDMIAQYLSLSVDPYPRHPGEEFGEWRDDAPSKERASGEGKKEGPFAALKNWRSRA